MNIDHAWLQQPTSIHGMHGNSPTHHDREYIYIYIYMYTARERVIHEWSCHIYIYIGERESETYITQY